MGFWTDALSWLNNTPNTAGVTPNANPPASVNPGDPHGFEMQGFDEPSENRSLPWLAPDAWSGYPDQWSTPNFSTAKAGINKLIDIAYACVDLNTNVLAAMPVYRTIGGQIADPVEWMNNPDPDIYNSWLEFAKQLFWDFQLGEAFVMATSRYADNDVRTFRVVPPWLVKSEFRNGFRVHNMGGRDVTDRILHIRYKSTIDDARGHGPLEAAGARMTAIGLLQRYANTIAENGGTPLYWMEIERRINLSEGNDLLDAWAESRKRRAGEPALVSGGAKLNQSHSMSAKDMALMELSQFNESRIATLLGVPPFLVGLAGASGSLTYSNIADLFDYHDRSSLRPKARMVMEALSEWALPRGQAAELNRDDYTRLPVDKRYAAYKVGIDAGFLGDEEVRAFERLGPKSQSMIDAQAAAAQAAQPKQNGQPVRNGQAVKPIPQVTDSKQLAAKALSGGAN